MADDKRVRTALHRWINYKTTTMESLARSIAYACNPKASPPGLQAYKFLSGIDDAVSNFEFLEKRFKKKPGRLYKHWIYVPGLHVDEMDGEKLLAFGEELLCNFFSDFPNLVAVHTNVPRRIHIHALVGCTNVLDGHKWKQSPADFKRFCFAVDELAGKYGIPLLRKKAGAKVQVIKIGSETEVKDGTTAMNSGFSLPYGYTGGWGGFQPCPYPPAGYDGNYGQQNIYAAAPAKGQVPMGQANQAEPSDKSENQDLITPLEISLPLQSSGTDDFTPDQKIKLAELSLTYKIVDDIKDIFCRGWEDGNYARCNDEAE